MSAEVLSEFIFQGWCHDCNEGNEPGEAVDANQWADTHNAEYHSGEQS